MVLLYDSTKLATTEAGFTPSGAVTISNPTFTTGSIVFNMNVLNSLPTLTPTKIGTLTFKALTPTETSTTQVFFGDQTKILSNNKADENLLATTVPANITITADQEPKLSTDSAVLTPTPTSSIIDTNVISPTPTVSPSITPVSSASAISISVTTPPPQPVLPATGPTNLITFGILGIILTIAGIILFTF